MGEQADLSEYTTITAHQVPTPLPDPVPMPKITEEINNDARTVYNYHRMNLPLFPSPSHPNSTHKSDSTAIFTLCSLDTRVAHHAASLFVSGLSQNLYSHLIFSGKVGALTAGLFDNRPEAEVFAEIATSSPYTIPPERVIIEPEATNTGENVRFTYDLLGQRGLLDGSGVDGVKITRFVLVQKPYMERRTYATFVKQWPGGEKGVEFTVTSPRLEWEEYPDEENPRELVISIMVGDLVRIREYPAKGYQIEQDIPTEVWDAGQKLIRAGFGGHLP